MKLFSIRLPLIKENEPLLRILIEQLKREGESLKEGDVIVIAEKVIATSQGRVRILSDVKSVSDEAKDLATKYDMDEKYVELILEESTMILGGLTHVILAKVNDFLIAKVEYIP